MPTVGLGTYRLGGESLTAALRAGLDAGYAHVDTAEGYHNEAAIGEVLTEYDRGDIWLTSKVLPANLHYESVIEACRDSLARLRTDYLDLYLVHWPNPTISLRETLSAMATLHEAGLVRNVGVSNFSRYQLRFARKVSDVPIAVNQVECHPWWPQPALREYATEHDIALTGAAPLARTKVLADETVGAIAEEYDRSPAQVCLRWALQRDVAPLPRSSNPDHVRENLDLFGWELDEEAMARLDAIQAREKAYMIDLDDETYGIPA